MTAVAYRPDIDGLRAIAVLSVVLYHFEIGGVKGGFVGVDVFFVISGYLITGIIRSELAKGEFTLARFYERRARRIFPALFVMLLATMVAGLFLLLPSDLARLGQATIATILFVSNVLYYRQSGYFDEVADFNPLLHTWSLGVEEQFYVGLPLLLVAVCRFRPQWTVRVVALCALVSFVACVVAQPFIGKLVFFLSPFRAWELLLGGVLALGAVPQFRNDTLRQVASALALVVLLGAVTQLRASVDFPGWKAAIPVLSSAVLLHAGASGHSLANRVLAWRPLVLVGLVSYSLYLWHWPLLVFVKYRQGMTPLGMEQVLVLSVVALLLAVASYRWVEQPFRRWRGKGVQAGARPRVFAVSGLSAMLLVAMGAALAATQGLPGRVPPAVLALDRGRSPEIPYKECDGKPISVELAACRIGAEGIDASVLVWGDSWAIALAPALDDVLKREGRSGILAVRFACAPLPQVNNRKSPTCKERNAHVLEWIRQHQPEQVYLIGAWQAWTNLVGTYPLEDPSGAQGNDRIFAVAYPRTLRAVRPHVKEIVVMAPLPGAPEFLPAKLALADWWGVELPPPVSRAQFDQEASVFWKAASLPVAGVRVVDLAPWFCDESSCRYLDAGRLLYRDGTHLSVDGARFVARHLMAADGAAVSIPVMKAD